MTRVLAAVREQVGQEPEVDYPTQDLEQFFLHVVEEARRAGVSDSGVGQSEGIATYLSGPDPAGNTEDNSPST